MKLVTVTVKDGDHGAPSRAECCASTARPVTRAGVVRRRPNASSEPVEQELGRLHAALFKSAGTSLSPSAAC